MTLYKDFDMNVWWMFKIKDCTFVYNITNCPFLYYEITVYGWEKSRKWLWYYHGMTDRKLWLVKGRDFLIYFNITYSQKSIDMTGSWHGDDCEMTRLLLENATQPFFLAKS